MVSARTSRFVMSAKEDDTAEEGDYMNLGELSRPLPYDNHENLSMRSHDRLQESLMEEKDRAGEDQREGYEHLDELMSPTPLENPQENEIYRHSDLEEARSHAQQSEERARKEHLEPQTQSAPSPRAAASTSCAIEHGTYVNRFPEMQKHLYITSYLILFSILGTLARLGLQALTIYPGAPVNFSELWANVGGSFMMGFLSEDRSLFQREWKEAFSKARQRRPQRTNQPIMHDDENEIDEALIVATVEAHKAAKKTIPVFIGLSVGFCGSFTSFSSFIRDAFLTLSNELGTSAHTGSNTSGDSQSIRTPGSSVMGVLAIVIVEICVCLSALECGAHAAIALQPTMSKLPGINTRRVLDPLIVFLAWGAWIGTVVMTIWPPDRIYTTKPEGRLTSPKETWRGLVLFALNFAPLGCLLRFHAALYLNGLISWFPLGTFVVNLGGTMVLGVCWDLQHASSSSGTIVGGRTSCQALQGVQDGFCGCLTTVSTWVLELKGLRRKHAYVYGGISVGLGIAALVVIMGTLIWARGVSDPICGT